MTILCVGVACLDIIHVCDTYPIEDSKLRSADLRWQRGGNASNSCTVLSLLGANCEFLGTIGTKNGSFMVDDFKAHGISLENCIIYENHEPVTATVIINATSGSRTALYCVKDLPELSFDDFRQLDLSIYSWIHFEGRNLEAVAKMMEHAVSCDSSQGCRSLRVSVELEVPSQGDVFTLSAIADFVFVGKDFALSYGWSDARTTLEAMREHTKPGATVIVPWGDRGAAARGPDGVVVESPAFPPPRVVDTLAAGDTFIAATIFALDSGQLLLDAITLGCRVAGAKVGAYGLCHIKEACGRLHNLRH